MAFTESDVYNNTAFFEQYMKRRYRENSPNESIEKPVFFQLIGHVQEKQILDLGCGDAKFGAELLEKGCYSYTGIEGSKLMCEKAKKQLENKNGSVHFLNLKDYTYPSSTFDLVTSRLALHYIEHLDTILQNVFQTLKTNGTFIFSVQHLVITSSFESLQTSGKRTSWLVDDYFKLGKRVEPWIDQEVIKYHRTTEEYFTLLQQAGFTITSLKEATPNPTYFQNEEEYKRRLRIPLFLLFSCTK
ncbi:SAM-dependent methyltransferase [Bacillus thuringiensis]|uniref:SAM-dependent methyltransferase n=1 Tax=Bacillus thuringiensis TaxID=1428 RepID=A0ABD6RYH2_BACTU|nr:class I SAM-dependent methyltransferase [Bacillus thuringiensis]PER47811.1 SAM-dependent methyltransferase [Bacillus thuringiensis]PEU92104.1 SAM-dependent methyltransferase [Bacillus thuringiensis]PFI09483.1 SAM-dependent methyltransferase [Bacillus thuringiensis]PFW49171.1 SAM-dependent methyltransferase [Bacillus thuringiensis]PGY75607.1 SAM-dependent methyltransferase [Bacillus thuringiensis]